MIRSTHSVLSRYGLALAVLILAIAIRFALDPLLGDLLPFATLFLGILVVAGYVGRGPALMMTGLGTVAVTYLFLPPRHRWTIEGSAAQIGMVLYLMIGVGTALLGGAFRNALRRSEVSRDEAIRQREQLRITLSSIGDAVIVTDSQGRIRSMNPVAERLTGWLSADAIDVPLPSVCQIIDEPTRQVVESPTGRAMQEGKIIGLGHSTVLIARDGTERLIDARASPIRLGDGPISGAVLVFHDISGRRAQEQELQDALSRLSSILTASEIGTWEFDAGTRTLRGDGNLARMFGLSARVAASAPIATYLEAIHPDDRDGVEAAFKDSLETGADYEAEYRLTDPSGTVRWVVARGRVERDSAGRGIRMPGVVVNITERKQIEERLRENEARFRTLFDSMDEGFCVIEMIFNPMGQPFDYRFLEMNPAFEKHSGLRGSLGQTIRQIAPSHEAFWFETYGRVAITGEPIRFMSEAKALNDRWFDVYAFRLGGEGSRKVAVLFNDVTEAKRAEIERSRLENDLRQLAADLSEADRRKDEFLATLAHELRNPLAPIRNGLQIMKLAGDDRQTIDESRTLMERQVTHMVRLIDDLMDVSRITRNKLELRRERIDLAIVVQNAVDTSRPLVEAAGHTLRVTLPPTPILVDADLTRLSQVFANLLNNAAKYTERGGEIALIVAPQAAEAVVSVRDNGVGIPPEMLPRVFEMFTQVDRSLERSQGGLGIGLSLVKTLVEMHRGSVEAHSAGHGQGSEFIVRLPTVVAGSAVSSPAGGESQPIESSARFRILVVDDNVDSARTLARLLNLLGYTTSTAHDGGEAVAVAEEYRPEVILLDIGLPVMNGYEVARTIRHRPWGLDVRIVALTGWGQEADRQRSQEAGIDHHLVKPVDPTELETLLAEIQVGP